MYLELRVSTKPSSKSNPDAALNCTLSYSGVGASSIDLDPNNNLVTRTALYLLRCHNQHTFPPHTTVHIHNPIPLGRGLGSSGAAVVAGALLGNLLGNLSLPKSRILDFVLMVERHPDNVAAALYGGFVGTYLNELSPEDLARVEVPLSEVLPQPAGGVETGLTPPIPPVDIGHFRRFQWSKELKAVAIIPDFEVSTAKAREVLPKSYTRQDMVRLSLSPPLCPLPSQQSSHSPQTTPPKLTPPASQIFNLQRLALLTTVLGDSPPDPHLIYSAMQDKIHQPYRASLIPALPSIISRITPSTHEGLCGICLSGAGPTILALATGNFEGIARAAIELFEKEGGIKCEWLLLEPAEDGASCVEVPDE